MKIRTSALRALAVLLATFCTGCATWYDVLYTPSPLEVKLADATTPDFSARALVSVLGVRRPAGGNPAQFELALRVENLGTRPFSVEPESLQLLSADLQPVGAPTVLPEPPPLPVEAGQAVALQLAFPLPPGRTIDDFNLSGINLSFALHYAERRLVASASFQRQLVMPYGYYYYDPFWPRWYCRGYAGVGHFHAY